MATDSSGNQRIAFEWGNVPMQPNNDRNGINLGSKGIHEINGVAWDMYPQHNGSRNYMITAAKALGGSNYEYTSQNDLIVGEQVHISGCGWANSTSPYVTYADSTKFRISDDLNDSPALTGLKGRVDVIETDVGHTLVDGGPLYIVPSYTFCYSNPKTKDGNIWDYIEYLRAAGVDPALLVEATFTGGANKYDWGTIESPHTRAGGIIFWQYIPADAIISIDWGTGTVYTGKDLNDTISAMYSNPGDEVGVANDWYVHSVVAITNDPNKNNTAGWWY